MENKQAQEKTTEETSSASSEMEEGRSYHAPKLIRYGGLAELVQTAPGRGADGGASFIDCRLR